MLLVDSKYLTSEMMEVGGIIWRYESPVCSYDHVMICSYSLIHGKMLKSLSRDDRIKSIISSII